MDAGGGTYSWGIITTAINTHSTAGATTGFTLYGTPSFAKSDSFVDPYGNAGGSSPPTSTFLPSFITALVGQFNGSNPKKLKWIEYWNEPDYVAAGTHFFTGTAAQMAAMAKTIKDAARSVDATITLFSPGFNAVSRAASFLSASDGAGGFGKDHIDALAFHAYGVTIPGLPFGQTVGLGSPYELDLTLRRMLFDAGLSRTVAIAQTEMGFTSQASDPIIASTDSTQKAQYIFRASAWFAALGWKHCIWYSHDDELSGNPSTNAVVASAFQLVQTYISNKTITRIEVGEDRRFSVTTSDGVVTTY